MHIIAMNMFDIAAKLVVVGLVCAFVKESRKHDPAASVISPAIRALNKWSGQRGYMGAEATLGKRCAKHGNTFHHDVSAATGPDSLG